MEDLKMEIWKPVKGFEGLYEVSNMGNVRSVDKYLMFGNHYCLFKGKPKKASPNSSSYLKINLYKNDQEKNYLVHRLVANAFIPNPNNLPCIDHINTIKTDNRVENLRWCTHKENSNNPLTREHINIKSHSKEAKEKMLATRRKKQSIGCEIPVYFFDKDGSKRSFKSMGEAQRQTNTPKSSISRSVIKKRPISGKQWYKEEKTSVKLN